MKQTASEVLQKQKKDLQKTQRSSAILPATMMQKKSGHKIFDSDKATSQIDEIDLDTLIQNRMVDRSQTKNKTKSDNGDQNKYEEVSPSWFN